MSDIPVGSPPAPPGRHAAPGGWYPDPLDGGKERYWDGWQWSRNTRATEATPGPPAGAARGDGQYAQPYAGQPVPQDQQPGHYPSNPDQQPGPYPSGLGGYPTGQNPQQPYPQQPYPQQGYQQPQQGYQQPYPQQPYPMTSVGYGAAPGGRAAYTADGVPLAGWWWRVLAVVIDSILVGVIAALPSAGIYARVFAQVAAFFEQAMRAAELGQPAPVPRATDLVSTNDQWSLTLISVAVALAYHVLFVRFKGATPGKMLCRMRIVPTDVGRHTQPLPWGTAVIRALVWVLPKLFALLQLFRLLDALFPLWHPKRQALHDMAAKTQVVKLG